MAEGKYEFSFDIVLLSNSKRLSWKHLADTVMENNFPTIVVTTVLYGTDKEEIAAWKTEQRHLFVGMGGSSELSRNLAAASVHGNIFSIKYFEDHLQL